MSTINFKDESALQGLISETFGDWSDPLLIDQDLIDRFADLSGDNMWMHVDRERAATESPFGCTIAHGFLILVLQSKMKGGTNLIGDIGGYHTIMNYGSDKLRFTGPVLVNSEISQRSRVKAVKVAEHKTTVTLETHIHVVGQEERPAVVYELMMVFM